MALAKRVRERIAGQIKRFKPILASARDRDVSESDTVMIIIEMLTELLGYRKFEDVTTEFAVRSTYVDLAVRNDKQTLFLIEAKAIGSDLKDNHVRQAIDYAANNGVEWVVLSNAARWHLYRLSFKQPIEKILVFDIDLLSDDCSVEEAIQCFGALAREEFSPSTIGEFFAERQAVSRYTVAAALQRPTVLAAVRRELRLIAPRVKVDDDELADLIRTRVLKREVVEGETAVAAEAALTKAAKAADRAKAKAAAESAPPADSTPDASPAPPSST